MINWLRKSIANKMLATFIVVAMATYVLTAFIVYGAAKQSIFSNEGIELAQYASIKLERLGKQLEQTRVNAVAWSRLEVMNDIISKDIDRRISIALANLKSEYNELDGGDVYVFDVRGKLVSSSDKSQAKSNVSLPQNWATDKTTWVERASTPFSSQMLALIVPIKASFTPDYKIGYLVVTYPWQAIEKIIFDDEHKTFLISESAPPKILISNFPELQDAQFLQMKLPLIAFNDVNYVAGYSGAAINEFPGWRIAGIVDEGRATHSLSEVTIKLLVLGGILIFPIILISRWLSKRLTDPLHELTDFVYGIGKSGDLSKRSAIKTIDEMGMLGKAFNSMIDKLSISTQEREKFVNQLEELNLSLEKRVSDRTEDLAATNNELKRTVLALKETQGQLIHQEKMASLGQLVAGVAHELNNPVGFMYANFPILEEHIGHLIKLTNELIANSESESAKSAAMKLANAHDFEYVCEDIFEIIRSSRSGASRIKEIVSSLRSFSRLDEGELKSVQLEDGLNDTLSILNHLIKGRIKVVRDYRLNQPVNCYAGQINQVFMNIIHNAIQAISGEGTITLGTYREDEWAVVTIEDTGCGIPGEILARIFDPFFTTKDVGEGTGLGLSISYGIIEKHGGDIKVESEIGRGTKFIIRLKFSIHPERRKTQIKFEKERRANSLGASVEGR